MPGLMRVGQALCLAIAIYHILAAGQILGFLGVFIPMQVAAAISLAGAMTAVFLIPEGREAKERGLVIWVVSAVLAVVALCALSFVIFNYDAILRYSMFGRLDTIGFAVGLGLAVALIEAVRRKTGIILPIIILSLVSIVIFQPYLPGLLYGRGYSIDRLLFSSLVGSNGIFGLPLRVAAEVIIVFVIFGGIITASGAGGWFLDLALCLTGRRRGGPAKSAVVASAMFGSVSGSPSANAASTGMLTIPLMIRSGYTPKFASGVEAVASTGGQILPPVMGAIAFVMAEWTGNSYSTIVQAALIPAILYILIIYASVHFQAHRDNIKPMDKADLPDLMATLRRGWFYPLPLAALCWFLFVDHRPAAMAAVMAMPVAIAVSFLSPDRSHWMTPGRLAAALIEGVHRWKGIAVITAAVGIMVGAMDLSGVGLRFADFIIDLSGGNLILALLMIGVAALILGMGLDSIPAYVTLATLLAPALVALGVSQIGAHFFVVYWGLASFFTPPLCIAVFVTCSISGANIWQSGWESMKLGLGAFLIPFAFVLEPALLMQGDATTTVISTISALIGAVALASAVRGYSIALLAPWRRILGAFGGMAMIYPDAMVSGLGLVAVVIGLLALRPEVAGARPEIKGEPGASATARAYD